ncbi:MAG: response regulator, partial [Myxococcota bacterium]
RALVVDDNLINRKVAAALCRRLGWNPETVDDGAQAVEFLRRRRVDVVLMDIHMPVMDGITAIETIRKPDSHALDPRVPIVVVSADLLPDTRVRCTNAGAQRFLSKPLSLDKLSAELLRWSPRLDDSSLPISGRVLLIDEDQNHRQHLSAMSSNESMEVVHANRWQTAQPHLAKENFDAIIVDADRSENLEGVAQIRSGDFGSTNRLAGIICTSHRPSASIKKTARTAGADLTARKPLPKLYLKNALQRWAIDPSTASLTVDFGPIDHYSQDAQAYAAHRPTYDPALFKMLGQTLTARPGRCRRAWDVGTGNGQAAQHLVNHFELVEATDISAEQVAYAIHHPRIRYRIGRAETSSLPNESIDLVSAAASAHWLNLDVFYREIRRVVRPQGIIALYSYGVSPDDARLATVIRRWVDRVLRPGSAWPQEIEHVLAGYRTLPFPFEEVHVDLPPALSSGTFDNLLNLMRTWSVVITYRKQNDQDPVELIVDELREAWLQIAPLDDVRQLRWPVFNRIGRL